MIVIYQKIINQKYFFETIRLGYYFSFNQFIVADNELIYINFQFNFISSQKLIY